MGSIASSVLREGRGLHASTDDRFGRTEALPAVDRETGGVIQTSDNPSVRASRGAGPAAAELLRSASVDAVIPGRLGLKAPDPLRALGIETSATALEALAGAALSMLDERRLEEMRSQRICR